MTGLTLRTLIPSPDKVTTVEFHPVKPWVLTTDRGGGAFVYNYETGERCVDSIYCLPLLALQLLGPSIDRNHHKLSYNERFSRTSPTHSPHFHAERKFNLVLVCLFLGSVM